MQILNEGNFMLVLRSAKVDSSNKPWHTELSVLTGSNVWAIMSSDVDKRHRIWVATNPPTCPPLPARERCDCDCVVVVWYCHMLVIGQLFSLIVMFCPSCVFFLAWLHAEGKVRYRYRFKRGMCCTCNVFVLMHCVCLLLFPLSNCLP